MADLVVIVPSRGRPEAVAELAEAFDRTCACDTEIVLALDEDDPTIAEYGRVAFAGCDEGTDDVADFGSPTRIMKSAWTGRVRHLVTQPNGTMVSALNHAAEYMARQEGVAAIGFMGDDHRPRTVGWDAAYLEALRDLGTGIVYGNDLLQGPTLPTQCAMTADIVRAVGHMAPPTLRHMYVDNYWRDLGQQAGCLRYLPDVVVEHMHPFAGKAEWTEGHRRVNDRAVYDHDAHAYEAYVRDRLAADVAAVRGLR